MGKIDITGKVECTFSDKGSKSEGTRCLLKDSSGNLYKLYRAEILPQYDNVIAGFDGKDVHITGVLEERNGIIRIEEITEVLNYGNNSGNESGDGPCHSQTNCSDKDEDRHMAGKGQEQPGD